MFTRFRFIAAAIIVLFGSVQTGEPQSHKQTTSDDEVLILIPTASAERAYQMGSRFYHRFSQSFLAGTTQETFRRLLKSGIDAMVVDRQPWSAPYFVISSLDDRIRQRSANMDIHILATVDDMLLVKTSDFSPELFKERGISFVEIEQKEIPHQLIQMYLPSRIPDSPDDEIARIISAVSDSTITDYILGMQNFGTRYCTNANRDSVFRWIRQRFLNAGVTNVVFDSFQYSGTWQKNVIATIPGTVNPAAEIIVGGHLDSYSSNLQQAPGADDNASGTTAALEMARVLMQENYQPRLTLRFIGFAAEEVGLRGSADYALKARQQSRDIKVMMNYDMIGNRNQGQPDRDFYIVWYTGSEAFSNLHAAMATTYTTLSPVFTTSYRSSSDSWSFYQQGYNTLFCIERDFSPYYHTPNDLLQYLDIPYARDIIKAGLAMLLTLDALPPNIAGLNVRDRGDGTSLFVQWDSVGVPDWYRYKVYVGTQPGTYTTNYLQTTRTRLITELTTGTRYYIGVSILDLAGNESVIVEQSEMPLTVPRRPQGIVAEGIDNGIRLTWTPNNEVDLRGYNIYRSIQPDTTFSLLNTQPCINSVWIDSPLTAGIYSYYVVAVDSANNFSAPSDTVTASPIIVGFVQNDNTVPTEITLYANYPNPFNPSTEIRFQIREARWVRLVIYDMLGRETATLVDEMKPAGVHSVLWHAGGSASGVYNAVLYVGSDIRKHRMVLLR